MNKYDISQQLAQRREKHKRDYHNRIRKLENISPEYKALTSERNALLAEAAIYTIAGNIQKAEANQEKARELDEREKEILNELGLTPDYLTVHYDCPICQDVGFTPNGGMCSCLQQMIYKARFNEYDLTERFINNTFENFDLGIFSEKISNNSKTKLESSVSPRIWMQVLKEMAEKYCSTYNDSSKNLLLYGPVGTGKTYLISCIVNELIKKDIDLIYISAPNLINLIFDDINQKTQLKNSNKERLKTVELLIIDDLGTEGKNEFNANVMSEILDERILTGKKTIITSNYAPKEMAAGRYPERMVSRIIDIYEMFEFIGPDLRSQPKRS